MLALSESDRAFPDVEAVVMALKPSYPVYCVRPRVLEQRAKRFVQLFPGTVLYAVKCNPHPMVLEALYRGGIRHFDTASLPEIAQICESFSDAKAYFMHPVKGRAVIRSAHMVYGVRHYVVDHKSELDKVLHETGGDDDSIIVVRLETPMNEGTLIHLAGKFGCTEDEAVELLKDAKGRGCQVGLAFHVGSQCGDPEAYRSAIQLVGKVIAKAGVQPACIDVGGGFPARYLSANVPPLGDYMTAIRDGLKDIKLNPTVDVFAEPGRALVAPGVSLLVQVQLRKGDKLYINDGIYGSLSEMAQLKLRFPCRLIRIGEGHSETVADFIMNGPTCDSIDILPSKLSLPDDIREGDWIEIDYLGAYSNAMATRFNGFYSEAFVQVFDDPPAALI